MSTTINISECNSSPSGIKKLIEIVDSLQTQLYGQSFRTFLAGYSYTVLSTRHKMTMIKGFTVLDPAGNEVEVSIRLLSDKSVVIQSNVLMDGSTLIIF